MASPVSESTLQGVPTGSTENASEARVRSLHDDSASPKPCYKPSFSSHATSLFSTVQIVYGFLAAVALTAGHHILLSFLDGRDVNEFDQFWIKNASNGFANVFSICIGFAATCALTQTKWSIASTRAMSIRTIDTLFALPAPLALAGTFARLRRQLLLPIFASILIQALVVVNILAPNALTITHSGLTTRDLQIPKMELYKGPIKSINYSEFPYSNVSSTWKQLINTLIINPPEMNWKIPSGCGPTCDFEFMYEVPALDCRDTTPEEYTLRWGELSPDQPGNVYEASSTLASDRNNSIFWENNEIGPLFLLDKQYDLSINYATLTPQKWLMSLYGGGTYCHFRNATYKASFSLANNTKTITTSIVAYGEILGGQPACAWIDISSIYNYEAAERCRKRAINTRATCEAFTLAFQGNLRFDVAITGIDYSRTHTGMTPLMTFIDNIGNLGAVGTIFNLTALDIDAWGFSPLMSNLSERLVGLFSNVTLGLIPHRNETTTVKGRVWDGTNVWIYRPWVLWAVYLSALLMAIPVILSGLFSILKTSVGMDVKFSDFLITTRNPDLDDVCKEAVDFHALQRVQLVHQKQGIFTVKADRKFPAQRIARGPLRVDSSGA